MAPETSGMFSSGRPSPSHSSAVIPALGSSPGSYRGRGAIGEVKDGATGGSFLVLRDPDPECRPDELEDPTPGGDLFVAAPMLFLPRLGVSGRAAYDRRDGCSACTTTERMRYYCDHTRSERFPDRRGRH